MSATIFNIQVNGEVMGDARFERESAAALAAKVGGSVVESSANAVKDQTVFVSNGCGIVTQTLTGRTLKLDTADGQVVGTFAVKGETQTAVRAHGRWIVRQ